MMMSERAEVEGMEREQPKREKEIRQKKTMTPLILQQQRLDAVMR